MSSLKMSQNLHTASGAYKRKLKKAKDDAHSKLLHKTAKLDKFLKASTVSQSTGSNSTDSDKFTDPAATNLTIDSDSDQKQNPNYCEVNNELVNAEDLHLT